MSWIDWGLEEKESALLEFTKSNKISRKKIFSYLVACVTFQISLSLFIMIDAI